MPDESDNQGIDPKDRRPVRSRQWGVIQRMGDALVGIGVSPNAVSLSSVLFAAVGLVFLLLASSSEGLIFRLLCIGAVVCVQLRLLANVLDGIVAEQADQASLSGRLFNEWPDRVSDALFLVGFGWLVIEPRDFYLGPLAACVAVMTAYVRELGRAVAAPPLFTGPLAKPQRMALLTVLLIVIAIWPGLASEPFWGPGNRLGLVETGLWIFIVGGAVTIGRRLRALHRFASTRTGGGDEQH